MSKSFLKRGAAAFDAAKKAEAQRQQNNKHKPFRFFIKDGESAELVILDESIEEVVGLWEHNLKLNGRWGNFEICLGEDENCPICKNVPDSKPYFAMFFTVLDLRGYTDKNGNEVPYSRKMLALKGEMIDMFKQIAQAAQKKHGTIRGVTVLMKRSGEKSYSTGRPEILEDGSIFAFVNEETLIAEFGHDAIKTKTGDIIVPENGKLQPFDYDEVFEKASSDELCDKYGWDYTPGGRKSIAKMLDEDDPAPRKSVIGRRAKEEAEEKEPPERGSISRIAKKPTEESEDVDPWDED